MGTLINICETVIFTITPNEYMMNHPTDAGFASHYVQYFILTMNSKHRPGYILFNIPARANDTNIFNKKYVY